MRDAVPPTTACGPYYNGDPYLTTRRPRPAQGDTMRIDDPAEREAWIARTAERLAPTLEGRIPADRVHALLGRVADLEVDRPQGDMTPGLIILQWQIEEQGFDPAAAALAARTIRALDWHALLLTATETAKPLGVGRTTLWRHRKAETDARIPPFAVLKEGTRDVPVFGFWSLLFMLAWQRRHPWARGQGARAYPPTRLH